MFNKELTDEAHPRHVPVRRCRRVLHLSGCSEETKVKESETVSAPGGKTTTTTETSVKSSGENPPTNSAGQTGSTPGTPK